MGRSSVRHHSFQLVRAGRNLGRRDNLRGWRHTGCGHGSDGRGAECQCAAEHFARRAQRLRRVRSDSFDCLGLELQPWSPLLCTTTDCGGEHRPVGPSVVGTSGGLAITGMPVCEPGSEGCQRTKPVNRSELGAYEGSDHPLMIGQSGETHGRLALESDGSLLFGDGAGPFDTVLRRHIARSVNW